MAQTVVRTDSTKGHIDKTLSYSHNSIRFLLGFFIYIQIITCASTRSSQLLVSGHRVLLENGHTNLAHLIGCSNWAIISIFDIAALDRWKGDEEDAHRLSLIELTKRGAHIEERLLAQLTNIDNNDLTTRASVDTNQSSEFVKTQITRIFAFAALTYLHVVISGAYPHIQDIKRSVLRTLDALSNLSDPKLLAYVAWPYCITGCFAADEKQQKSFRELVTTPRITHGACLEALGVMEECWRLRNTESSRHDWASVMERRGQGVLLI